ncbi:GGDEF domain-containing protein [uncultured Legionella sp.]|uniref:GGDEF domain-containing protein n=1 Tax=uncultured Legionella sp. TaxID=210934 RepID=UPI00261FA6CD|nr:GGDEF domain-containing protein [uncultured Legionella sp.]
MPSLERNSTRRAKSSPSEQDRKYKLLHAITIELLLFGIIFTAINIYLQFWIMACLLFIGSLVSLGNLILLKKKYSILFCAQIINSLCLLIMTVGNLCLGGISSTYFGWFYITPILAAATIGLEGLIFYSGVSAAIVFIFIYHYITPIYQVQSAYLPFIDDINHIFIFLLIITIMYNLLKQNDLYVALLKEQNFLLNADKKKFHYLSNHDPLTNLPNRSYFNTYLQQRIDAIKLENKSITLFFMDLNEFKQINDQYGHDVGDTLLLQVGKRLQTCFREQDFLARLGGDEFTAIISYKPDDTIAEIIMHRILNEFSEPFHIKNMELKCSISVGEAHFPRDASNAESLLNLADSNMYKNKKRKYKMK